MMRITTAALMVSVLGALPLGSLAQVTPIGARQTSTAAPATAPATSPPAAPPAPATPPLPPPSSLLQGSLNTVQQTLDSLRVEKWKRGSVRDEASDDIHSIVSDMQTNMPPLLKEADGGPGSLSKMLPLAKHVDALYDVLLRVVEAARMAAPDEQATQLRQALSSLSTARLALDDRMQDTATAQEKQVSELRVTVEKQAAFKCPAPPPPPACPQTPAKRSVRRRPAAKPGTNQQKPSSTAPPAGAKPQASTPAKSTQKPANQQSGTQQKTGPQN
ncbi:MAG TPA: hypothetical protein VL967_14475 [Terracidiphilus sp.]|nr:hypothetical protein [Terracidiphilus sp.]